MSLLDAINDSNPSQATEQVNLMFQAGRDVLTIHDSIYSAAFRALNLPFISPHLPKMYRICRELFSKADEEGAISLLRLEINEYSKRRKMRKMQQITEPTSLEFTGIEQSIRDGDAEKTARLFAAFQASTGLEELARRLLLLGSGYLGTDLGHSISCTSFILLEILEHPDQDPWPALTVLAEFFCRGRFTRTPPFKEIDIQTDKLIEEHVLRAVSGYGIGNLHDTITFYAINKVQHLFTTEEYSHLVASWIDFLGTKKAKPVQIETIIEKPNDYAEFFKTFSRRDVNDTVALVARMLESKEEREMIAGFLVRGVSDLYQGDYDPHFITGLGSALWMLDTYHSRPEIALTALHQYLAYFY
ncbi:MAG TPA: hypothetical protein VKM55_13995 [Candidatus Lokiarchaeia archaeon]|nr:hypothetical protein [Candidatus Lokiarchaeia archaeon]